MTEVTSGSGKWTIDAPKNLDPNDATSSYDPATNTLTITFDIKPGDIHTDNEAVYNKGAEYLNFVSPDPHVANADGYKTSVVIVVKNDTGVNLEGFHLDTYNNTFVANPNPNGHPVYAHFHNITPGITFGTDPIVLQTRDGQISPGGPAGPPAASQITDGATILAGTTFTSKAFTLHEVELNGSDNGFMVNWTTSPNQEIVPVYVTGAPTSAKAGNVLSGITVHDTYTTSDSATIILTGASYINSDYAGKLSGNPNLTYVSPGVYSLKATDHATLTTELRSLVYTPGWDSDKGHIIVDIDNGAKNNGLAVATRTDVSVTEDTSPDGAYVNNGTGYIKDANGHVWSIFAGRVNLDGYTDTTTARVVALAYVGGKVWQENADKLWWAKTTPTDSWSPGQGTATPPLAGVTLAVSANNTVLANGVQTIIDTNQHTWSIVNGQVSVDGHIDGTTARVIELAYENGQVWQENADHLWWAKTTPADQWLPYPGTPVSPVTEPGVTAQPALAAPDTAAVTAGTLGVPQPSFLQLTNDPAATADGSLPANPLGVVGVAPSDFVTASGLPAAPYTPPAPASFGFVTPDDPSLLAMVMHNHG